MDALQRAINIAGGQTALAKILGVRQAAIWNWQHRQKRVPAERVLAVEAATEGVVSRHELRPDLYPPNEAA